MEDLFFLCFSFDTNGCGDFRASLALHPDGPLSYKSIAATVREGLTGADYI